MANRILKKLANKNRSVMVLVAVLIAIAAVSSGIFLDLYLNNSSNTSTPNSSGNKVTILLKADSVFAITDGSYRFSQFSISQFSGISGTFNSTYGVQIFFMTSAQLNHFISTGDITSFIYSTGREYSGTIHIYLQPGTYHIVLANDNGFNRETFVTFVTSLTATPLT